MTNFTIKLLILTLLALLFIAPLASMACEIEDHGCDSLKDCYPTDGGWNYRD